MGAANQRAGIAHGVLFIRLSVIVAVAAQRAPMEPAAFALDEPGGGLSASFHRDSDHYDSGESTIPEHRAVPYYEHAHPQPTEVPVVAPQPQQQQQVFYRAGPPVKQSPRMRPRSQQAQQPRKDANADGTADEDAAIIEFFSPALQASFRSHEEDEVRSHAASPRTAHR